MNLNLFKELGKLPRHINSPAYDYAMENLSEEYRFDIITYDSSSDHNGWVIPPKYSVKDAYIKHGNKIIYDGKSHPLKVISYSAPFAGLVTKDELVKHCFYDHRNENWIPYHFRQSYRPWDRDWGFCVPKKFIDTLIDGEYYEVLIKIEEGKKELKIGKGIINGKSSINIALCAHLDHPGLFNDDLSGVIVILEAFKRLKKNKLNYGLEILIVPEIIGTQYYLNKNSPPFEGLFVESVGQNGAFYLQKSLKGGSLIDTVSSSSVLKRANSKIVPSRSIYSNDEINFETYGCPMPSLTRGKFIGYHSDQDNYLNISPDMISEAVDLVVEIITSYQKEIIIEKKFFGLMSLANPKFDLYIDPGQLAFNTLSESENRRKIMDAMSTISRFTSVSDLLKISGINDVDDTINYLRKWEDKNLIKLHGL